MLSRRPKVSNKGIKGTKLLIGTVNDNKGDM